MTASFRRISFLATLAVASFSTPGLAAEKPPANASPSDSATSGLYVKVLLSNPVKVSKLKPGEIVEGTLSRDVYAADHKLYSAGNRVQLTVDHLEKVKRPKNDHWPWVVNAFTPRHQNYPSFKTATVSQSSGDVALQVTLISIRTMRDVHAQAKKDVPGQPGQAGPKEVVASKSNQKKAPLPTMILIATPPESSGPMSGAVAETAPPGGEKPQPTAIPAGTGCKILLLGDVSASKSKPGDPVQARLLEPVLINSVVALPAGTLFTGTVIKKTPPRMLSRAGSLYLGFTQLALPEGRSIPITASLATAEIDRRSHTRIDAEGQLRGERPGSAWMAINLGVTAGLAKEADDTLQLIIEAIVSTATDASTAGSGRIAAGIVSGIFMATRHGRDVVLPQFTELQISLDRPVSLEPPNGAPTSSPSASTHVIPGVDASLTK
jgi:hypothetical protein